jgi:hypothetical protein
MRYSNLYEKFTNSSLHKTSHRPPVVFQQKKSQPPRYFNSLVLIAKCSTFPTISFYLDVNSAETDEASRLVLTRSNHYQLLLQGVGVGAKTGSDVNIFFKIKVSRPSRIVRRKNSELNQRWQSLDHKQQKVKMESESCCCWFQLHCRCRCGK